MTNFHEAIEKILNSRLRVERVSDFLEENKNERIVKNNFVEKEVDLTRSQAMLEILEEISEKISINELNISDVVRCLIKSLESKRAIRTIFSDETFFALVKALRETYYFKINNR